MKIWFDTLDYERIDDPDFNMKVVKELYENISEGVSIEDACALVMIKPEQYYKWLEYDDFKVLMEHAQARYRALLLRKLTKASKNNPQVALKQLQLLLKEASKSGNDIYDEFVKIAMESGE